MRAPRLRFLAFAALAGTLAACGDRPAGPGAGEPLTPANAAGRYALASCALMEECACSQSAEPWTACEEEIEHLFESRRAAAERDGLTPDLECLERRIAQWGSQCVALSESCLVMYGGRGAGEPCFNYDPAGLFSTCARGLFCPGEFGYCVAEDTVFFDFNENKLHAGEQCLDEASRPVGICDWTEDLFCDVLAPVPVCAVQAGLGEACSTASASCVAEAYCDGIACRARRQEGEACGGGGECAGSACLEGQCTPGLTLPGFCTPFLL